MTGHVRVRGVLPSGPGVAYLCAFASLWGQIRGLIGSTGIAPVADTLDYYRDTGLLRFPTLLWISGSDRALDLLCALGVVLSTLVVLGFARLPCLVLLWAAYLSLFTAGLMFTGFQWDTLLLECGFLAIFLAPSSLTPWGARGHEASRLASTCRSLAQIRFSILRSSSRTSRHSSRYAGHRRGDHGGQRPHPLVRAQCGARSQTGVQVWKGSGTPIPGVVTVTFASAPTSAVIVVARYSGADPDTPLGTTRSANTLGVGGACSSGTDTASFGMSLQTTVNDATVFTAVAMRSRVLTPGTGYTQRELLYPGPDGSIAGLAVVDQAFDIPSVVNVNGSFDGTVDWAVVGVEMRPYVVRSEANGSGTHAGAGSRTRHRSPHRRGGSLGRKLPCRSLSITLPYTCPRGDDMIAREASI